MAASKPVIPEGFVLDSDLPAGFVMDEPEREAGVGELAGNLASGINRGVLGIADALVGNPVASVLNIGAAATGNDPIVEQRDPITRAAQSVGIGREAETETGQFVQRIGEDVGTALPIGAGIVAKGPSIARSGVGLIRDIGKAATTAPGKLIAADAATSVASGTGAAIAERAAPGNRKAEIGGHLAGSLAVPSFAAATRLAIRGGEAGRKALERAVDVFGQSGTSPTTGQASASFRTKAAERILASAPGGAGRMVKVLEKQAERIGSHIQSLAGRAGATEAGRTIERGITGESGFIARFRESSGRLFDKLDDFIPKGSIVSVRNTHDELQKLTAPIEGAPALSGKLGNDKINSIRDALVEDAGETLQLPYQALKDLRSQVGRQLSSSELISEAPKAALKQLYGALTRDMKAAAETFGPEAIKSFNRANKFYAAGLDRIEGTLQKIINKANPEDVFLAATRGKDGATVIRTVRKSMKSDEWRVVAGAVARRMGRANPSNQDDLSEVFSPETFLTNWNRLAPESRTALFGDVGGLGKNLDAVAEAAATIREAGRVLFNPSGTAPLVANIAATTAAGGAIIAGDLTIPAAIGGVAFMSNAGARVFTSPSFVKWLAQSTAIPISRLPGHIARLSSVAAKTDPDVARAIQDYATELRDMAASTGEGS